MTNTKNTTAEKPACCGACDCIDCACGCAKGACRCDQTDCQCGCRAKEK